jgi:hypothetical protein
MPKELFAQVPKISKDNSVFKWAMMKIRGLEALPNVHSILCDTIRMLALSWDHTNVRKGHTCGLTWLFTASADKQMPEHTKYTNH